MTPWPGMVLEWRNSKTKIRYVDSGKFEEKDVHTLAFEQSDGSYCNYHFSQETGLLNGGELTLIFRGTKIESASTFEYSTVEGIVLPLKKTMTQPDIHTTEYEFEVVKIGGEFPDEYFEMSETLKQRWEEIQQLDNSKAP